ncbi:hypothetical protein [Saccharomonospora sp. CUA-673]|uniref:hypothetical protein n=1 Tax=Saccharomonospora sp. CUA-673 TaxID=1904969 RepID=UPI0009FA3115|nr:hypothetical protein [Saccharomonospora sp. CUA-673]
MSSIPQMPTPMIGMAVGGAVGAGASFAAKAAASPAGGGYEFSPEEIDNAIQQWEELRSGLRDDIQLARQIANVQAPADEPASSMFTGSAGTSGEALVEQTQAMIDHCNEYIRALKRAKGVTEETDAQAAQDATSSGGGAL